LPPQTLKPGYGPGGNWPKPVTRISQLGGKNHKGGHIL